MRYQDQAQKNSQPSDDEWEIVTDGGQDGIGGVAGSSLEIAAAEMALGLHVPDHMLDGGAAAQLALAIWDIF